MEEVEVFGYPPMVPILKDSSTCPLRPARLTPTFTSAPPHNRVDGHSNGGFLLYAMVACVRYLPQRASREVYSPEVLHGFGELNSHCPFAVLQAAYMHDPAFSLFTGALIYE